MTADRPVVSVVLGTYERLSFLRQAVESVRGNGLLEPCEIIVIDGGSGDGTIAWLAEQKDVITILQHNRGEFRGRPVPRRGWGYFMNLGFRAAHGTYLAMISDDCLLLPGALGAGLARFRQLEAQGRDVGGVAFYFRNWPREKSYYVQRTLGGRMFVNHGMYRRSALERVGFADEELYVFYKADGDLCLRMWSHGYEVVDCPGAFVEHHEGASPELRQANLATLQRDREAYVRRWKGIYEMGPPDLPDRLYSAYEDAARTAERAWGGAAVGNR